jgi:putative oxidoreductase
MNSSLTKDIALLILRLAGLALAFLHGWSKVDQLIWGDPTGRFESIANLGFPMPGFFAWCLALTEFGGGLLITFGLFTRVLASFAAFAMFVATFMRHKLHLQILVGLGAINVPEETVESWGNPETALLFLLIMLSLVLMGAGRISLDHLFGKSKKGRR